MVSGSYVFTGCKYVCSVMRFYCPPYCRFKLNNFLSYCFPILQVHWYWSEDTLEAIWAYCDHCRSSLGQGCMEKKLIAKQTLFSHCDNLWKIGCQLFFLVVHMSPPRWGLHFLRLWYSWICRVSTRTPKYYKQNYQSSDGGPYVQGYQDAHNWWPHHIGDICTTRFSYMSHNVTKCTFWAIFFLGGGRPEHVMSKVY